MTKWVNDDGLVVRFGTDSAAEALVGAQNLYEYNVVKVKLDFGNADTPIDADGSVIIDDAAILPAGAQIVRVEVDCSTDYDSVADGWVFDMGIVDAVDRTSNADVDGLIDAATQAEMITGGSNVAGWVGAKVTAVLARDSLLTWETTVADLTAGEGEIRIYWRVPSSGTDTLIQS
jgi:hypothetical protein